MMLNYKLMLLLSCFVIVTMAVHCPNPGDMKPKTYLGQLLINEKFVLTYTCYFNDTRGKLSVEKNGKLRCLSDEGMEQFFAIDITKDYENLTKYDNEGFVVRANKSEPFLFGPAPKTNNDGNPGKIELTMVQEKTIDTRIHMYILSDYPMVKFITFPVPDSKGKISLYSNYLVAIQLVQEGFHPDFYATYWYTDIENVTVLQTSYSHLPANFPPASLQVRGLPAPFYPKLPKEILYENMRQNCLMQKLITRKQTSKTADSCVTLYLVIVIVIVGVINILMNCCTLRKCRRSKWYALHSVTTGMTIRYMFDSLRLENEIQYEQIYLLMNNLNAEQKKNIFVIKKDGTYGYDYARVSRHFLRSPKIYENIRNKDIQGDEEHVG